MIPQVCHEVLVARGRCEKIQVGSGLISLVFLAQDQLGKHTEMGIWISCLEATDLPKWTVFDPTRQASSCR